MNNFLGKSQDFSHQGQATNVQMSAGFAGKFMDSVMVQF